MDLDILAYKKNYVLAAKFQQRLFFRDSETMCYPGLKCTRSKPDKADLFIALSFLSDEVLYSSLKCDLETYRFGAGLEHAWQPGQFPKTGLLFVVLVWMAKNSLLRRSIPLKVF